MNIRITKEDTLFLKGLGILMIITHNFFHIVKPIIGENEFVYVKQYILNFITNISLSPLNSFQLFSSYFGHYGVQIFIFCSGYGLTLIYSKSELNFKSFILKRLYKLYPTFIIGIVLLLAYQAIFLDFQITTRTLAAVFIRITLVANWIPDKIFSLTGPYWFYSMIVQLYLIFPLLLTVVKKNKQGLWFIMLFSYIIIILLNNYFSSLHLSLYYNFIGNLPVFILGIIMAYNTTWYIPKYLWFFAVIIFVLGQFNSYLWSFSQVSFILMTLPLLLIFHKKIGNSLVSRFFIYTGRLSMYLFAIHGFMRMPWVQFANIAESTLGTYLYASLFLILVYLLAIFTREIEQSLLHWIKKNDISTVL